MIDFFIVKNFEGNSIAVCGNAIDAIYENNPRNKETKIVTRSGAIIVTREPFNDVMKKYDDCLRRINVGSGQ